MFKLISMAITLWHIMACFALLQQWSHRAAFCINDWSKWQLTLSLKLSTARMTHTDPSFQYRSITRWHVGKEYSETKRGKRAVFILIWLKASLTKIYQVPSTPCGLFFSTHPLIQWLTAQSCIFWELNCSFFVMDEVDVACQSNMVLEFF